MKIELKTRARVLYLSDLKGLDPIYVMIYNHEPHSGRITISCFDTAWTAYWGAMSGRTIEKFFTDCNAGYLADNLIRSSNLKQSKHSYGYLLRIVIAVQEALSA